MSPPPRPEACTDAGGRGLGEHNLPSVNDTAIETVIARHFAAQRRPEVPRARTVMALGELLSSAYRKCSPVWLRR